MSERQIRTIPKLAGGAGREIEARLSKEMTLLRTELAKGLHHLDRTGIFWTDPDARPLIIE